MKESPRPGPRRLAKQTSVIRGAIRANVGLVRRSRLPLALPVWAALLAVTQWTLTTQPALAAEADDAAGSGAAGAAPGAEPSRADIEAWLEARSLPDTRSDESSATSDEVPPPPPRARGLVVESGLGAMGYLGTLKHVTPTSPWLHLQLGYEIFDWAMVFAEGDLAFASTSYANPPPQPRAFAIWGLGGGVRFTVRPTDRVGIYLQGSIGAAQATEDVLRVYGYRNADELNPYYGGLLGVEWYQVSPHYALSLAGGARNYDNGFARRRADAPELMWLGLLSLRYAF